MEACQPLHLGAACHQEGSWGETCEAWERCGLSHRAIQEEASWGLAAVVAVSVLRWSSSWVASDPAQEGEEVVAKSEWAGRDGNRVRRCGKTLPWESQEAAGGASGVAALPDSLLARSPTLASAFASAAGAGACLAEHWAPFA